MASKSVIGFFCYGLAISGPPLKSVKFRTQCIMPTYLVPTYNHISEKIYELSVSPHSSKTLGPGNVGVASLFATGLQMGWLVAGLTYILCSANSMVKLLRLQTLCKLIV